MTVAYVANVGFVLNLLIHPHIYIFILQVCQLLAFAVLRLFHYLLQNHKFNLFIIYISIDLFFALVLCQSADCALQKMNYLSNSICKQNVINLF